LLKESDILTPLRGPFLDLSNAAFVTNLRPEVRAPDAANPAKKDCRKRHPRCGKMQISLHFRVQDQLKTNSMKSNLHEFWTHESHVSNHPTLNMSICNSKSSNNCTYTNKRSRASSSWRGQIHLSQLSESMNHELKLMGNKLNP